MRYQGGKARIWSWVVDELKKRWHGQPYIEPFLGGAWIMSNFTEPIERYGSDLDADLICMWQAVQTGWEPPDSLSEERYYELKATKEPSPEKGFAKFGCSWGGKPWGGYARQATPTNFAAIAKRSIEKKRSGLHGAVLSQRSFSEIQPINCLIYCDPPYEATTGYSSDFDSTLFWNIMRQWSERNDVLVSSYQAPEDFQTVAEVSRRQPMRIDGESRLVTEKLFAWNKDLRRVCVAG